MALNGMIIINKPPGFTSHDVVAKLRGMTGQKKIGHTGTLDPEAVGVLPVCLGNATRLCDMLIEKDKEYVALLRLGLVTDTQDMTGRVLSESAVQVEEEEVYRALEGFRGEYDQLPPMYSALKVRGKRLYELAREGKEVERKPRRVQIKELELLSLDLPEALLRVACSKGAYIRTLCHDLGQALGCGGVLKELTRTRAGEFTLDGAVTLEELGERLKAGEEPQKALEGILIPTDRMFSRYPALTLKPRWERLALNGNPFLPEQLDSAFAETAAEGGRYRVYSRGSEFIGLYEYRKNNKCFYLVKMFGGKA